MFYLIQDARPENDPHYAGFLAQMLFVGFSWTMKPERAKRFDSAAEASKIAQALTKQNRKVNIVAVGEQSPSLDAEPPEAKK